MTTKEERDRRNRIANPWMARLLRSPLHGLISGNTMLITVTGMKTARRYTTPVNYVRDGNYLIVTSRVDRTWWRNLRGGSSVELWLRGSALRGHVEVIEGSAAVSNELLALLRRAPQLAGGFHVKLGADGQPKHPEKLAQFAAERVLLRIGRLALLPAPRRLKSGGPLRRF